MPKACSITLLLVIEQAFGFNVCTCRCFFMALCSTSIVVLHSESVFL
ncbi:MAG: hypothetical protein PHN35_01985 [Clostridia bacterium]|nr:hypothetical protein [Clostridia bacterium]